MNSQNITSPTPLMWAISVAIVLFCGVGIAAFMGWIPASGANPSVASVAVVVSDKPSHKEHASNKSNTVMASEKSSAATCAQCGVIESIRVINSAGSSSGLGIVGGAVVGGLLGNQVGGGHGKDVATVAGAIGGAVAGDAIEKNAASTRTYAVTVRFEDGSRRVYNEANTPVWQTGDHVRVVDGEIRNNG